MKLTRILLVLLILVTLIILVALLNFKREHFSCYRNKNQNNMKIPDDNRNIWMYWENKPGTTKPNYLKLCFDTIRYHCNDKFRIYLLDQVTIYKYLPTLRKDLAKKLEISPKSDYIRYHLLEKYGGIWIDADTIIMKDISPIIEKLKNYDFVGFGCHYGDKICQDNSDGYPRPATWVMASRRHSKLMKHCCRECNIILDKDKGMLRNNYFAIGRNLLWKQIDYLLKYDINWKYYHYNSRCIERDSKGNKLRNHRSISDENIDSYCKTRYLFVPIYNTAPGFPKWFVSMPKDKLITSDMLISKLFRYSLNINNFI